ncbi:hypothetical protein [Gordonia terrae]|uniref:Uncharacterized protein n=2 Tax=Gordonia terrae TaxID=2055 RepID=A0AAD0K7E7_9ACTN|nr:hypothetical protein [Gordonia terrae]VTR02553.1 Uncharacterised protein [Clostridioides difficile]ANY23773.1 hypothetical protein BCM27_14080 [Gordonia terrae]AWO84509.1 hypothetical protein DLJ61_14210 [Gordonia terrae]VTS54609.1 Uncharacterised protein [Gordonia terrae]GAB45299.1 hypothetical protein GOTRE_123_00300 [Gordonia terrae NBRC 100016]
MVPVTCRTEFLTGRHHRSATAAWLLMVAGMVALVALNVAGVDGLVTSAVVGGALVASLLGAAYGRLGERGAVLLTVDEDAVYFGNEDRTLVSYPLDSLVTVAVGGPADATSDMTGERARHLTVLGQKYLKLTFATQDGKPVAAEATRRDRENDADSASETDFWRVAVVEGDPAVAEILARLRRHAPERVATKKKAATPSGPKPGTEASGAADDPVDLTRPPSGGPRIADAGSDEAAQRLWEEAARRHDEVLGAYGTYELDPAMLLRYPAVTDVTVDQTQTFHLALDEAMALRTDEYPGNRSRADAYQQSVARLRRAWIACEKNGRRVGASYLEQNDQDDLDRALKLYNHAAASSTPAEQATYYGRVRDIVSTMTDRGVLHPPEAAVAELQAVTRRALEAGTPKV